MVSIKRCSVLNLTALLVLNTVGLAFEDLLLHPIVGDEWVELSVKASEAPINSICGGDIQGLLPGVGCVGRGYDIFALKVDPIQFGAQVFGARHIVTVKR